MEPFQLQGDADLLDSVCITDGGMCECLSFTGKLSHLLLADVAAVYTFLDAASSSCAKIALRKAKRIVFFVSWLSFECKNAMRAIMAECAACEDVCVYSAVALPEDDPLLQGLDLSCRYLPYAGRAYELQDVELCILPATATCVGAASFGHRRDEIGDLLAAQLAELFVSRRWKPHFRVVNDFCDAIARSARARIEQHCARSSASGKDDQHCFVVIMDRLADVSSALQPAECVLQTAMDVVGGHGSDVNSSLEEVLMWTKGSESLQAHANGLDALLERRLEDAIQEVADMDSQNSLALKGIQAAAQAILGAAHEKPSPQDSPFRSTISAMMKVAEQRGQEEEVYQQLLDMNAQLKCDPLTVFEACCCMAYCMKERFQPSQDFKDSFENRLEGTSFNFNIFWSAVQYCCDSRCRASESRDGSQSLISFILDRAIEDDDVMNSMLVSSSGSLGSFMTGMLSGLTRGLADWKPSQCSVICLVVLGGVTPDEIRCMKQYGSKLGEQTLVVISDSLTSRNNFGKVLKSVGMQHEHITQ